MTQGLLPLILVLLGLNACKDPATHHPEQENVDPALMAQILKTQDSAQVIIEMLVARYDSVAPLNELDAMKTRNVREMAQENLIILRAMTDSLQGSEMGSSDQLKHEENVRTQIEYLTALLASGRAILANNSQSFGKWTVSPMETGDSTSSQVAKTNGSGR